MMKICDNLDEVRQEIDGIDAQIIALIAAREKFVLQAAKFKKDTNAVKAPNRVEQVIAKVKAKAIDLDANPDVVEVVYRTMIDAFIQQELLAHKALKK
ncbi:chorismate mutase [Acinetobacter puyangensis]|uniref:chorismate mutase n=1 Tax=Acinetobacter puyangensis TaxID=1096779 RepID=UPI003A4E21F1